MPENTPTQTRPEMPKAYLDRLLESGNELAELQSAVTAWLIDEVKELRDSAIELAEIAQRENNNLRSELAELRHRVGEIGDDAWATHQRLAAEVRTRRVVVVNERGHEGVVVSANDRHSEVTVTSEEEPSVWSSLHANDEGEPSSGLYLSGGENGVGSFEVNTTELADGVVDYDATLHIDTDIHDPRFHDVSLDRKGLHFGG